MARAIFHGILLLIVFVERKAVPLRKQFEQRTRWRKRIGRTYFSRTLRGRDRKASLHPQSRQRYKLAIIAGGRHIDDTFWSDISSSQNNPYVISRRVTAGTSVAAPVHVVFARASAVARPLAPLPRRDGFMRQIPYLSGATLRRGRTNWTALHSFALSPGFLRWWSS